MINSSKKLANVYVSSYKIIILTNSIITALFMFNYNFKEMESDTYNYLSLVLVSLILVNIYTLILTIKKFSNINEVDLKEPFIPMENSTIICLSTILLALLVNNIKKYFMFFDYFTTYFQLSLLAFIIYNSIYLALFAFLLLFKKS